MLEWNVKPWIIGRWDNGESPTKINLMYLLMV